jgi:hypothetical protein
MWDHKYEDQTWRGILTLFLWKCDGFGWNISVMSHKPENLSEIPSKARAAASHSHHQFSVRS